MRLRVLILFAQTVPIYALPVKRMLGAQSKKGLSSRVRVPSMAHEALTLTMSRARIAIIVSSIEHLACPKRLQKTMGVVCE